MMFWKTNSEVNCLMWKWTRTGILYPTSGCETPEIVLLNDLHSPCVCDFYESCCKIWNTWNLGVFRAVAAIYFPNIWFIPAASVTFISLCRCGNSQPRHHQLIKLNIKVLTTIFDFTLLSKMTSWPSRHVRAWGRWCTWSRIKDVMLFNKLKTW